MNRPSFQNEVGSARCLLLGWGCIPWTSLLQDFTRIDTGRAGQSKKGAHGEGRVSRNLEKATLSPKVIVREHSPWYSEKFGTTRKRELRCCAAVPARRPLRARIVLGQRRALRVASVVPRPGTTCPGRTPGRRSRSRAWPTPRNLIRDRRSACLSGQTVLEWNSGHRE